MDMKKELSQIHAMLGIALENCEVSLRAPRTDSTQLDGVLETVERVAVRLRTAAESIRPAQSKSSRKPDAPKIPALVGEIEVTEFGWVHITLNTLLPGCKYKTPLWLENTLAALLLRYREHGRKLPKFQRAMLIIEERCDISNRRVYDQDNKGWKAIPNAIKGLLIEDDDQFTLEVALLSRRSDIPCCHIWILPSDDAGEYFSVRSGCFGSGFPGLEPW